MSLSRKRDRERKRLAKLDNKNIKSIPPGKVKRV